MVEWKTVLMSVGFVVLCFVGIPVKIDKPQTLRNKALFQEFLLKYNKTYPVNSVEYDERFANFESAVEKIEMLNSQREAPDSAFFGITKFSDLSEEEFSTRHLRKHYYKHSNRHGHHKRSVKSPDNSNELQKPPKLFASFGLPNKIDWRTSGVVTPVKNQKACGACWAFSTIENVESMNAIRNKNLTRLSVQQVIDCAKNGNFGCNGGDTCSLLEWLTANQIAIETESQYPLVLKTDTCKAPRPKFGIKVAANYSCDYFVGTEDLILSSLANHGPVVVAVNALPWQFYLGGVIQFHCPGEPEDINHAVQLVGYDLTAPSPHFIARNSWGTLFGEKGYVKLGFGNNVCGLATEVVVLDTV